MCALQSIDNVNQARRKKDGNVKYELTPEPTALFKDRYIRRPNKSILRNKILGVNCLVSKPKVDRCVADGGSLLHKTV